MQPKSRRLVTEANLEHHTSSALYPVQSQVENLSDRTGALETMGGLAPGEVTDAQTADLIQQDSTTTRAVLGEAIKGTVYDIPGPTGSVSDDVAMVLAAAQKAVDENRKVVTIAPGHYQFDGVTVDDIQDRYLVGDNVTFTRTSFVYPFSFSDLSQKASTRDRSGGRGRIAIELDDASESHWYFIFPITKELGITMGTAWHTDNGAQWIKEAHRHGWEVISHLPENTTAVEYLNMGRLDEVAQSSLDAVAEIVGTTENIGFVYPQHGRNDETDRILSKYYSRGRGFTFPMNYPQGMYHPWVTSAFGIDDHTSHDGITEELKSILENIANTDGQMVFYAHSNWATYEARIAGLRALVSYARHLGIDIVNPGQIWGDHNVTKDPYFEGDYWTPRQAAEWDSNVSYHGDRSLRLTAGTSPSPGVDGGRQQLPSKPGLWTVLKLSFRYKADEDIPLISAEDGFVWNNRYACRTLHGQPPFETLGRGRNTAPFLPAEGSVIPPAEWNKVETLIYVEPSAVHILPELRLQNSLGSAPIWIDEIRVEAIDHVPEVRYTTTMQGTGNASIETGTPHLSRHNIKVVPKRSPEGEIRIHQLTVNRIVLTSTSPNDSMEVDVYITPNGSFHP